jgi:oligopeptide/dipeptide ABC transporter ATP-binding protein
VLRIENLRIGVRTGHTELTAVAGVSLEVRPGEALGLVGESGCGKSLTAMSITRLLPQDSVRIMGGQVTFDGRSLTGLSERQLRGVRGRDIGMIFQEPMTALNPAFTIGNQLAEPLRLHRKLSRRAAADRAGELLAEVGIDRVPEVLASYPHQLSGGMRQRVMIAMAMSCEPKLLIADEPTTALDVTTQAQILELLLRLRREHDMAVVLVSHDFGVIAQVCDRVAVMYGGHVVETASFQTLHQRPEHPYTRALLESVPAIESAGRRVRRQAIPGQPPELSEQVDGCVFRPRCRFARDSCREVPMTLEPISPGHASACPVRPFAHGGERAAVSVEERT